MQNLKRALIIGDHQLSDCIKRQYLDQGWETVNCDYLTAPELSAQEIVILPDPALTGSSADEKSLKAFYFLKDMKGLQGAKVHLMLVTPEALMMVRRNGFSQELGQHFDILPFSLPDEWSRKVRLDYQPIDKLSEKRAHLVIFGSGAEAELIAINAALSSHFPNYIRDNKLRTRITLISPKALEMAQDMTRRYPALFDNSHYRMIDIEKGAGVISSHKPMYPDREEFVDVEWEFVRGDAFSSIVRDKLEFWRHDPKQLLTLAIAQGESMENLCIARELSARGSQPIVPTYVWINDDDSLRAININFEDLGWILIGSAARGYDVNDPLIEMAKRINYVYTMAYEDNKDYGYDSQSLMPIFTIEIDDLRKEQLWQQLPMAKRMSSIYNAMAIPQKLRSVGLEPENLDHFHDLTAQEIAIMSEVEHNRWSVEELILGYRPCTDSEQEAIRKDISLKKVYRDQKIHYDLRAYSDLRADATGRSSQIYDTCLSAALPLIISNL